VAEEVHSLQCFTCKFFNIHTRYLWYLLPREIDVYLDSTELRTSTEAELRTAEHRGELESEVSEARFEDDLTKQK
jgi:hypothetical protein